MKKSKRVLLSLVLIFGLLGSVIGKSDKVFAFSIVSWGARYDQFRELIKRGNSGQLQTYPNSVEAIKWLEDLTDYWYISDIDHRERAKIKKLIAQGLSENTISNVRDSILEELGEVETGKYNIPESMYGYSGSSKVWVYPCQTSFDSGLVSYNDRLIEVNHNDVVCIAYCGWEYLSAEETGTISIKIQDGKGVDVTSITEDLNPNAFGIQKIRFNGYLGDFLISVVLHNEDYKNNIDDKYYHSANTFTISTRIKVTDEISIPSKTPVVTQAPTITPTAKPSISPTIEPSSTPVVSLTPTATPISSLKPTIVPSNTPKPSIVPSNTPKPTITPDVDNDEDEEIEEHYDVVGYTIKDLKLNKSVKYKSISAKWKRGKKKVDYYEVEIMPDKGKTIELEPEKTFFTKSHLKRKRTYTVRIRGVFEDDYDRYYGKWVVKKITLR